MGRQAISEYVKIINFYSFSFTERMSLKIIKFHQYVVNERGTFCNLFLVEEISSKEKVTILSVSHQMIEQRDELTCFVQC